MSTTLKYNNSILIIPKYLNHIFNFTITSKSLRKGSDIFPSAGTKKAGSDACFFRTVACRMRQAPFVCPTPQPPPRRGSVASLRKTKLNYLSVSYFSSTNLHQFAPETLFIGNLNLKCS